MGIPRKIHADTNASRSDVSISSRLDLCAWAMFAATWSQPIGRVLFRYSGLSPAPAGLVRMPTYLPHLVSHIGPP